jgi:hypothetical protein
MQLNMFYTLRDWLLVNTRLKSSKGITVEEKLVIFLHITTWPASNRDTQERFSRSGDTMKISYCRKNTVISMGSLRLACQSCDQRRGHCFSNGAYIAILTVESTVGALSTERTGP